MNYRRTIGITFALAVSALALHTCPASADPPSIATCKANGAITTSFGGQQLQRNKICVGKRYKRIFAFWQASPVCDRCPRPQVIGHLRLVLYKGKRPVKVGRRVTNPRPPYRLNIAHRYGGLRTYSLVVQEQVLRGGRRVWLPLQTSPKCLDPTSDRCKAERWIVSIRI